MESLSPTGSHLDALTEGIPMRCLDSKSSTPRSLWGTGSMFEELDNATYGILSQRHNDSSLDEIELIATKRIPSAHHLDVSELCWYPQWQEFDVEQFFHSIPQYRLWDQKCVSSTGKAVGSFRSVQSPKKTVDLDRVSFRKTPEETADDMQDAIIARYSEIQLDQKSSLQIPCEPSDATPKLTDSPSDFESADEDEPLLFSSVRRLHSTDATYPAEDVISALKALSQHEDKPTNPALDQPANDAPGSTSRAPANQGSTAKGSRTYSHGSQAHASPSRKRKKTGDKQSIGDDGDYGSDEDEEGRDGLNSRDTAAQQQQSKQKKSWKCPYGLLYPDINNLTFFKSCRQHGIKGRDQFWSHLRGKHYDQPPNRPNENYKMSQDQHCQIDGVIKSIPRVRQGRHNEQAQLNVDLDAYRAVWNIIFPEQPDQCPDIPYYLDVSTDELKQICEQVFDAYICVERQVHSRSGNNSWQPTIEESKKILVQVLSIALDSQPAATKRLAAAVLHNRLDIGAEHETSKVHQQYSSAGCAQPQSSIGGTGLLAGHDHTALSWPTLNWDIEPHQPQQQYLSPQEQDQPLLVQQPSFAHNTHTEDHSMVDTHTTVILYNNQPRNKIVVNLTSSPGQNISSMASAAEITSKASLLLSVPRRYNVQVIQPPEDPAQFRQDPTLYTSLEVNLDGELGPASGFNMN